MIWHKILSLSIPLVHFDENPFNVHYTDTWGPLTTRMLGAAELTAGQKTRTDSPSVRRVSLRRSLLKGLAEIPFMVSWLEGNNVMGKGATSDSTECSPEGIDEQGWFERMGRTKYVFQSTTQPIDPLLQQHSLPFPLTNFPLWFLYCTKLRYKYLLSSTCTIFCLPSSIFHGLGTDSSSQEEQSTSPHSLARPGQCVSASSPPAELLCLATQPPGKSSPAATGWRKG